MNETDNTTAERMSRVFLRPIANPLPMAFVGLAGASSMLSAIQLGWLPVLQSKQVGLVVVLIAVPLQLIACVMGFLSRDPVAATGVGTLAVSWLTIGILTMLGVPGVPNKVLGLVLFYLAAAVFISALVAAVGKLVPALVLGLAAARFALTGVYQYYGGTGWMHLAGWVGVALAAVAIYAALALELEGLRHRTILPTLRYGAARTALSGGDGSPIGAAVHEAGVRSQL